jgi:hypothetical protein
VSRIVEIDVVLDDDVRNGGQIVNAIRLLRGVRKVTAIHHRAAWVSRWSEAVDHLGYMCASALADASRAPTDEERAERLAAAARYAKRFDRAEARLYIAAGVRQP